MRQLVTAMLALTPTRRICKSSHISLIDQIHLVESIPQSQNAALSCNSSLDVMYLPNSGGQTMLTFADL